MLFLFFRIVSPACNTKITDYFGELIDPSNYSTNHLGFKVQSKCSITIDGKPHSTTDGISEIKDNYIISDGENTFQISIKPIDESKKSIYTFFNFAGTMPSLLSMIDFIKNEPETKEIYMTMNRANTFNGTYLLERYPVFKKYEATTDLTNCFNRFKEILRNDPNAYFRFFVDDIRCRFYYIYGLNSGLDPSKFEYRATSDGAATYTQYYSTFDKKTAKSIQEMQGRYNTSKVGNFNVDLNIGPIPYAQDMFPLAQLNNCELWLGNPSLLIPSDNETKIEHDKLHLVGIDLTKTFNEMTVDQQDTWMRALSFNKTEFKEKYFPGEKPPLLIIATNGYGHFKSWKQYKTNLDEVVRLFGDNYSLIYKPHPQSLPGKSLSNYLSEHGIPVVGDMLPTEILLTVYDNMYLGGFTSTLFLAAQQNHTLFFFAKDMEALGYYLYLFGQRGYFDNAIYINKEALKDNKPLIIGLSVAGGVILIVVIVIVFICIKKRKKTLENSHQFDNRQLL